MDNEYTEEQKFMPQWLFIFLIILEVILIALYLKNIFDRETPISSTDLIFGLVPTIIPPLILATIHAIGLKLILKIDENRINIRWHPFNKEGVNIALVDVAEFKVIKYSFVGYGWRFSQKYGTVNNVDGNVGLLLTLKNKSKYLIGTQNQEELSLFINNINK